MLHLSHIFVLTLIIQLPQACETYSFNASSERWIFREVFSVGKDTLGRLSIFSERRHEYKYFNSYQD